MTPSAAIVREAGETRLSIDKAGRRLLVRRLAALDILRLFKAAGPVLSQNTAWLSMAALAVSVIEIDGVPLPPPTTEAQIENLIARLGDDGLAAIAEIQNDDPTDHNEKAPLGNLPGTPS
jgi:hypothetical protein